MRIALFPNFEREGTSELLCKIIELLNREKLDFSLPSGSGFGTSELDEAELYDVCDAIITIGGDGTLIKHAKEASKHSKVCLGVNTGHLGFLADIEKDRIELLRKLKENDYTVENRMMLSVTVKKNDEVIFTDTALNDVVISSGRVAKITDIKLMIEEDEIDYRADGVIVSTPTGSTAYSMSAGGPIIDPSVRCLTVTPVCSHSLTARPMILGEASKLALRLIDSSRTTAVLTVDGVRGLEVDFDTVVEIEKSPFEARFINLSGATIYKTISQKF